MRHRLFLIDIEPGCVSDQKSASEKPRDGYYCRIYANADTERNYLIDSFSVVVGKDIPVASDQFLHEFIRWHIDANLMDYMAFLGSSMERLLSDYLNRAACLLSGTCAGKELYDTLHERIGLSEDGIRAIGFFSLAPFFDKRKYANDIAVWLMNDGTLSDTPKDYRISFDKINTRYNVQLPQDRELLDEIVKHLDPDIVEEVKTDGAFRIRFNSDACPYYFGDEELDSQSEVISK